MSSLLSRTALAACLALAAACSGGESSGPPPVTQPPPPAPVATVAVTPGTGALRPGRTLTLAAALRDAAGNALTGRAVAWRSSAEAIARVDANGVVTGVAVGAATITATSEGKSAEATVAVQAPGVAAVAVAPDSTTLALGESRTLVATVRDDEGAVLTDRAVRWTSSAPAVAVVDSVSGVVRALGGGSAVITATSDGKAGTARLAVRVPVHTVSVATALDTLEAWDVVPLQATLRDANGAVLADRVVRWTSSDTAVASIDSVTGRLTGRDRGTVTVTATSEGKLGTASRVVVIRYRSLSAGSEHACDIASGGIVWCWGRNGTQGRLGMAQLGAEVTSTTPVRLATDLRFTQISTYEHTTCGVTRDARVYCWGSNRAYALGAGSEVAQSPTPLRLASGESFRQVAVSGTHACALTAAGQAWCWGSNGSGQFGTGATGFHPAPVAAGGALRFTALTVGTDYTCGLTAADVGYCWGADGIGQLGDGQPLSLGNTRKLSPTQIDGGHPWHSLSASNQVTCGVTTSAAVHCWGRADGNRLGSAGSATSTPRFVSAGFGFRQVSVGGTSACAVALGAEVWCWGLGANGQLGQALVNGSQTPVRVGGGLRAAEVSTASTSAGEGQFACAVSADRLSVHCWGRNTFGQLGNGSTSGHTAVNATPTVVVGQRPLGATR